MIVVPASLRSDFIHMAGMTIHIALESTIHIVGIRSMPHLRITRQRYGVGMCRRGVLVHCPSRLRAAVAVLTAELLLSFVRSFVADKGMPHKKSVGLF